MKLTEKISNIVEAGKNPDYYVYRTWKDDESLQQKTPIHGGWEKVQSHVSKGGIYIVYDTKKKEASYLYLGGGGSYSLSVDKKNNKKYYELLKKEGHDLK